jgi:hypothetical protein
MNEPLFVLISYFSHEPSEVWGFFETEQEARDYAESHQMTGAYAAYDVKQVQQKED